MDGLDVKDVTTLIADMILAGIDTSSYTSGFLLYEVARNHGVAGRIRAEDATNGSAAAASDRLRTAKFAKNVLKESLRLHPISIGTGRIAVQDCVMSGYYVPKGVVLISQNQGKSIEATKKSIETVTIFHFPF